MGLLRKCRVFEHRKIDAVVKVFVGGCLPCPSRLSARSPSPWPSLLRRGVCTTRLSDCGGSRFRHRSCCSAPLDSGLRRNDVGCAQDRGERPLQNSLERRWKGFEVVVEDCVSGILPRPSFLSAPVTLTLTLSCRAGEGKRVAVLHGFAMVSRSGVNLAVLLWVPAFAGMTCG